ncbi:MAG: hypothetical protein IKX68_03675 [Clostridiales bacterium]|nr:hypothetical protein [Clostridiales bacterium]
MNNSIKLPDFLSHLEVVGTLKEELELCRAPLNVQIDDPNFTVENYGSPAMAMPPSILEAYQRNDQATLKASKDQNYQNLETIKKNITANGDNAWVKVTDKNGVVFFLSYNNNACVWIYPEKDLSHDKTQLVFSLGSFDNVTKESSFSFLSIKNPYVTVVETIIMAIVVKVASKIIARGLSMAVEALALTFAEAAAEAGWESFVFLIPEAAITAVAYVFAAILAIGLVFLIDWIISLMTADFYIGLQIFNFDDNRDWSSDGDNHFFDNAKIAGNGEKYKGFTIPKRQQAKLPPFIADATTEDIIVSYAQIDLENDSKFMEGLGVALSMKTDDASFTLASDCPYIGATVIKETTPAVSDLERYFKDNGWCDGLTTNIDVNGMPVGMVLNTHHGAENNVYCVTVLIGRNVVC